jgi:hypothetical protein
MLREHASFHPDLRCQCLSAGSLLLLLLIASSASLARHSLKTCMPQHHSPSRELCAPLGEGSSVHGLLDTASPSALVCVVLHPARKVLMTGSSPHLRRIYITSSL